MVSHFSYYKADFTNLALSYSNCKIVFQLKKAVLCSMNLIFVSHKLGLTQLYTRISRLVVRSIFINIQKLVQNTLTHVHCKVQYLDLNSMGTTQIGSTQTYLRNSRFAKFFCPSGATTHHAPIYLTRPFYSYFRLNWRLNFS